MSFSLQNFHELKAAFQETLYSRNGEPVSCQLYGCTHATGALHLTFEGIEEQHLHIAEACNIASVINSVMRILSLPRSNVACEELSEILILRLDILREYIRATAKGSKLFHYQPSESDKIVQRWAGFLKHPSQYVFAHHCFTSSELSLLPEFVEIDSEFLARWGGLSNDDKDKRKGELAHSLVFVTLPDVVLLKDFFASCANHVDSLIRSSTP